MSIQRPAVFLERDTILVQPAAARDSVPAALLRRQAGKLVTGLRALGYQVIGLAHDPGMGPAEAHRRQQALDQALAVSAAGGLDAFYACRHRATDDAPPSCSCCPPGTGLLLKAAAERRLDVRRSFLLAQAPAWFVAGRRAGVRSISVGGEVVPGQADHWVPHHAAAAGWIERSRASGLPAEA